MKNLFTPAGYDALRRDYGLQTHPHYHVAMITNKRMHKVMVESGQIEEIYPPAYCPENSLSGHLEFAFKHEGMNLELLAALFVKVDPVELVEWVRREPTGKYARRAWFLYEFLTGLKLDLPDLKRGNYVDLLNPEDYYTVAPIRSPRHRINNNLCGDRRFCPLVRRTQALADWEKAGLDQQCRDLLRRYPEEMLNRALSYLYTKETKASFDIEHEMPGVRRSARFASLLRQADKQDYFTKEALIGLQRETVDPRFAATDYRGFQNYVGENISPTREVVHYVPPRPEDLSEMMDGYVACLRRLLASEVPPVVTATVAGFGFVFLHPFEDGNGRMHRFLIHHVLAKTGFTPEGVIFPVSATMLKQHKQYDEALEWVSRPLMELVEYRLNARGELKTLNETAVHYRYLDMTRQAERLYEFVQSTIEHELTDELDILQAFDKACRGIQEIVDMPDRRLRLFIRFCLQNKGRLAKNRRPEFAELTDAEIAAMETVVMENIDLARVSVKDKAPANSREDLSR